MTLLFVIALVLAWPTVGLSLVAYFVLVGIRAYLKGRLRHVHAVAENARREVNAGAGHPPSWANNEVTTEAFTGATFSEASRKGVPASFINTYFQEEDNKSAFVRFVGLIEASGASMREQGVAATNYVCDVWQFHKSTADAKGQRLRELLADARVQHEVSSLIQDGFMWDGDKEVAAKVEECLEIARVIRLVTGQEVDKILRLAM